MTRIDTLRALAGQAQPLRPQATGRRQWFRMAKAPDSAVVHVYDFIGGWDGITALEFVQQINDLDVNDITVHINSGGGDVFDAISMHAALLNHKAKVATVVDGVAASAASFLAMAGDSVSMEKPARMMIHDASGLTIGNEADHLEMAKLLGQVSDTIAEMYSDRAGGTVSDWRSAMRKETWYTAHQAVDAGLADAVLNDSAPPSEEGPAARRSQLIRARSRVLLKGN